MSAEIVNLRRARKTASREAREVEAAANRARHGRTKADRAAQALETGRATRLLDGAKRDGISGDRVPRGLPPDDGR